MKARILSDTKMRMALFSDKRKDKWYYSRRLVDTISFNITINKRSGSYEIDVLDEESLQPYPYVQLIRHENELAIIIGELVDLEIERLKILGVLEEE